MTEYRVGTGSTIYAFYGYNAAYCRVSEGSDSASSSPIKVATNWGGKERKRKRAISGDVLGKRRLREQLVEQLI